MASLPSERLLAAREAQEREAQERGAQAYHAGTPYTHCPYYWDTAEARAWKNSWLAEKERCT